MFMVSAICLPNVGRATLIGHGSCGKPFRRQRRGDSPHSRQGLTIPLQIASITSSAAAAAACSSAAPRRGPWLQLVRDAGGCRAHQHLARAVPIKTGKYVVELA
jgi:hypothetical protein